MTGFSDNVTLGEIGNIKKNPAVVMRIQRGWRPRPRRDIHWRGMALTDFDGRRWFTPNHDPRSSAPIAKASISCCLHPRAAAMPTRCITPC